MKIKLLFPILLFAPLFVISQNGPRKVLNGLVISDSLLVENITVLNKTSNMNAVTDEMGNFTIYARPLDTLFFSGLAFRDAQLVLNKGHFEETRLVVRLDVNINVLDEVVVTPLTGNLAADAKKVKIKDYNDGYDSSGLLNPNDIRNYQFKDPNTALPQTESNLTGIDFIRLYKLFVKKKKKKRKDQEPNTSAVPFSTAAKERFTYYFFTETLKIPHDQIGLFLAFCEKDTKSAALFHPDREFELIDFLVLKSKEYLENKK